MVMIAVFGFAWFALERLVSNDAAGIWEDDCVGGCMYQRNTVAFLFHSC